MSDNKELVTQVATLVSDSEKMQEALAIIEEYAYLAKNLDSPAKRYNYYSVIEGLAGQSLESDFAAIRGELSKLAGAE